MFTITPPAKNLPKTWKYPGARNWHALNAIQRKAGIMADRRKERGGAKRSLKLSEET